MTSTMITLSLPTVLKNNWKRVNNAIYKGASHIPCVVTSLFIECCPFDENFISPSPLSKPPCQVLKNIAGINQNKGALSRNSERFLTSFCQLQQSVQSFLCSLYRTVCHEQPTVEEWTFNNSSITVSSHRLTKVANLSSFTIQSSSFDSTDTSTF